jgi:hypothetical protein
MHARTSSEAISSTAPNGSFRGDSVRYLLLILPSLAAVSTPFYNSVEPRLFGVPFFYWFLLALVPVSSVFIYLFSRLDRP